MSLFKYLFLSLAILTSTAYAQENSSNNETLSLPGDNLDLYATLDLFQNSKTIEEFEASLNNQETGINNLDLNTDGKVDFIKVITQQDKDDFAFILQIDVLEKETQDVAVIIVTKDTNEKVNIQIVGNENLYGKDYVIEPELETPAVTANPAYSGPDTVVVESKPATVVVLESEPIVHYVYSTSYVHYYPPYYYGYYPPYYHPYPVVSFNIYVSRNRHYYNRYRGGHRRRNTTVIVRNNYTYNNYKKNIKTSNTVNNNKKTGKYNSQSNTSVSKPNTKQVTPSKTPKNNPSTKPSNPPKTKPSNKPSTNPSPPVNKPSPKPSNRPAGRRR